MKASIDYLAYLAVRLLICTVQAMRLETCEQFSGGLAVLFHRVLKIRHKVVDENLRHAFPQLSNRQRDEIALGMWKHLFFMVAEIAHARRKIHVSNWLDHVELVRDREMVANLLDPRPTVMVTGHYGNFEVGGYLLGLLGFPTYTVARPLENPYLDRWLNEFRGSTGQYMLPKKGSAQTVSRILSEGKTIAVLGDQAGGHRGCWIDFFNRPASAHKAIAVFSLESGGPMMVTFARRKNKPLVYETGVEAIADPHQPDCQLCTITELTQWYSDRLADIILQDPSQYWWVHRRWKGTPYKRGRKRPKRVSEEQVAARGESSRQAA